jgi:hypothetical protein
VQASPRTVAYRSRTTRCRHGRKNKSHRSDGYKRHIAPELDSGAIIAGEVLPAYRPAEEAMPCAQERRARLKGLEIGELSIDRGSVFGPVVDEIVGRGGEAVCRPWVARPSELF